WSFSCLYRSPVSRKTMLRQQLSHYTSDVRNIILSLRCNPDPRLPQLRVIPSQMTSLLALMDFRRLWKPKIYPCPSGFF
ncbi:unnamed protein product, partial [Mycena citricolor]